MSMRPGRYDITIERGTTYDQEFTFRLNGDLVDLSGFTGSMDFRRAPNSEDVDLAVTSENGRLQIGGADGTVRVLITADDTEAISMRLGSYRLDLVSPDGTVRSWLKGKVAIID